jgi:hypothetical protein
MIWNMMNKMNYFNKKIKIHTIDMKEFFCMLIRQKNLLFILMSNIFIYYLCLNLPQIFSPERDVFFVPFAIAFGLYFIYRLPDDWQSVGQTLFLIFVFFCILIGRWHSGLTDGSLIAGRIPFNDAAGYIRDAVALLDGSKLSYFSSRRPIHVLVLAAFLKIAGGDFAIASVLLICFTALAIAALAMAIRRAHGSIAAFVFTLLIILFYRRFIGTSLSEHAGLAFGCLATALLWRGAESKSEKQLLGGAFLLTIALVARAGCFFVLPALILWIGWITRRQSWLNWAGLALSACAVAAGFLLNGALLHIFGTPGSSFANFPFTLYGLIVGGDWHTFYVDYPDIVALPEAEAARQTMSIVLAKLRENPWLLWSGAVRAWRAFFNLDLGQFTFVHQGFDQQKIAGTYLSGYVDSLPAPFARISGFVNLPHWPRAIRHHLYDNLPWILLILGLIRSLAKPKSPHNLLILASWAGILASIPFNPPWDSDSMRSYAATMPLQMATVALGASWLFTLLTKRSRQPKETMPADAKFIGTLGLSIAAGLLSLLLAIRIITPSPASLPPATLTCAIGEPHLARSIKGAEVKLTEPKTGLFGLRPSQFETGFAKQLETNPKTFGAFTGLPDGTRLFFVTFLDSTGNNIVILRGRKAQADDDWSARPICVKGDQLVIDADNATPSD